MLNAKDREKLVKSLQTVSLFQQDVLDLSRADNPLLADIGYGLLEEVATLQQRLERLNVVTRQDNSV